jgi:hypothetical protein
MIDTLFTIGQAASALLMLYGGYLVLMPARAARREERVLVLKHLHSDA